MVLVTGDLYVVEERNLLLKNWNDQRNYKQKICESGINAVSYIQVIFLKNV